MIVVHPTDLSTSHLRYIYEGIDDVKLFTSYKQRDEILSAIAAAPKDEPILLLGHGTPNGLMDMDYGHLITNSDANILRDRPNLVGIWCYASSYAYIHSLKGFFSGMFISEPKEARDLNVKASNEEIERCFTDFSKRFGNLLREGRSIKEAAMELMDPKYINDTVTKYNYSRLEYRETENDPMPIDIKELRDRYWK
ncbi:MAG: hypothetical protein MJZ16_03080 [Bacteroidales bacterium]|nr:hypothetical protein [Bacteroidales bacterium]